MAVLNASLSYKDFAILNGNKIIAATILNTRSSVNPKTLKGSKISHTKGKTMIASKASGQHKINKMQIRRMVISVLIRIVFHPSANVPPIWNALIEAVMQRVTFMNHSYSYTGVVNFVQMS